MQTQEELDLQNALISTFNQNLQFLSHYDQELFQRVSLLSDAIGSGQYTERYLLDFVKENSEFDIFDSHTKTYLYDQKPKQWNSKAVVGTNFDMKSTINLLNPNVYTKSIVDLTNEQMSLMKKNRLQIISDIQNYKDIKFENINDKNKKVQSFNKFIFVGTLLGRHIPKIVNKLKTVNHFVCESNLEIFRLSLFVCDYSLLATNGRSVIFSIMEDEQLFSLKFHNFFENDVLNNTIYKYFSTNYNIENYFDRFLNIVLNKDPFLFEYTLMLNNVIKLGTQNFNIYKTLNSSLINKDTNIIDNHNILFLGAGPSLGKNIKWVQKNQDKFIIVALGATLKKLEQYDIKPDIITTLDPQEKIVLKHFENINQNILENSIKFAALNTPNDVFNIINKNEESLYTFEVMKSFQQNNIPLSGISVGEVSLKLIFMLNPKNIYLLGIDLSLDQETGHTHVDTHSNYNEKDQHTISRNKQANESMLKESFSLREETVLIKGNILSNVETTRLFNISLLDYNHTIQVSKSDSQNIYNFSENGAFIENTIPTKIDSISFDDVKSINKKLLHNQLIKKLNTISVKNLDSKNKKNIFDIIIQLDTVIQLIKTFNNKKIKSHKQFQNEIMKIAQYIWNVQSNQSFKKEIFLNFHFIINRYIDFVFNNKQTNDDSRKIKIIQYIWCNHILNIFTKYKSYLQNIV